MSYFAYPSPALWPVIFVSILGLYWSVRDQKFWRGFLIGFFGGAAFYVAQIYWISQYLGPRPLFALALIEAIIFAVGFALTGMATRRFKNAWVLALTVAILWNAREWVATHFPYGGFPWSRVAMSQSNSPLASWVSIGGFGLLSFLIVAVTVLVAEKWRKQNKSSLPLLAVVSVSLFAIPIILGGIPASSDGQLRIAGIQGNAKAGLFSNEEPGTVLKNHLDATDKLLASGEEFDLVVWPENASDLNPDNYADVEARLRLLVDKQLETPFIFGTITSTDTEMFNSSKLWLPGRGEVDQYDKKRPVPFGEYIPDREFFYQLAPDLVGMIYRGYSFGQRDGIFEINGVKNGILICFEVAIDEVPREVVDAGARVIIAQTNNADFGRSDESVQQLAIARLRAIETGRSFVNISTVGPSAIFDSKGNLLDSSEDFVSDYVIADVPLSSDKTITMSGGWMFDPVTAILGLLLGLFLLLDSRRESTKL